MDLDSLINSVAAQAARALNLEIPNRALAKSIVSTGKDSNQFTDFVSGKLWQHHWVLRARGCKEFGLTTESTLLQMFQQIKEHDSVKKEKTDSKEGVKVKVEGFAIAGDTLAGEFETKGGLFIFLFFQLSDYSLQFARTYEKKGCR